MSGDRAEPLAAEAAAGERRRWFEHAGALLAVDVPAADDASGGAPGDAAPIEAFRDALALEARAPLLDCLDAWLGTDADWRPTGAPDAPPAVDLTLEGRGGEGRVGLVLAAGAAPVPDALPDGWEGRVRVHRARLEAVLVLDRFALGAADVRAWEAGALVVLPGSFRERWEPLFAAAGEAFAPPVPGASAAADGAPSAHCAVLLADRVTLPGDALDAPDAGAAREALDDALARLDGARCELVREDGARAPATLARLGAGYGAVLDGFEPDAAPGAAPGAVPEAAPGAAPGAPSPDEAAPERVAEEA